ncbi:MAG: thioesterase domain-containing protein [Chitinophagaceae bacterium]
MVLVLAVSSCKSPQKIKQEPAAFLPASDVVLLNQVVYKPSVKDSALKYAPDYDIVYLPQAVNGNLALIVQKKGTRQYALVIRGSLIEFSNDGFQNFILQDFNIFNLKKWDYADSVKEAYIGRGTYIGFQNLLQLKDGTTGLSLKEFIEQKIPDGSSLVVTGHSLGGNLAYPLAGYLKKELAGDKKNILQLITFGAPAAGNAAFVQDMEEKFPAAERYVIDKDIAPAFPDNTRMGEIARTIGLDKALHIKELSMDAGDLLNLAGKLLEETNVINKSNKYVQSQKHLRLLKSSDPPAGGDTLSAEALFGRAYQYHKVDAYALLLGGKAIE